MSEVLDLLPPVRRAVHAAVTGLDAGLAGGFWQLSDDDVDVALGELRGLEGRCAWLRLGLVQQARDRGLHGRTGAPDLPRWLAERYGLDPSAAGGEADLALAVRPGGVAAETGRLLAAGRIGEGTARLVVGMLDRLPTPLPGPVVAEAEQILLGVAEYADPAAVRRVGRELAEKLTTISPDGPAPADGPARTCQLTLSRLEPGWWRIAGTVDDELAALIDAALTAYTHPQRHTRSRKPAAGAADRAGAAGSDPSGDHGDHEDGGDAEGNDGAVADPPNGDPGVDVAGSPTLGGDVGGDPLASGEGDPTVVDDAGNLAAEDGGPVALMPLAQRRADALRELCALALRCGQLPAHGGTAATMLVGISLADLQQHDDSPGPGGPLTPISPAGGSDGPAGPGRSAGRAELIGTGGGLAVADARRVACDAGIIPVLLGADSRPLDYGRTVRACPAGLRRILDLRDGGCVFPHCGRPPSCCDAHHLVHWADGGTTSAANLCLLCPHHHRQIHRQHWQLTLVGSTVCCTPPASHDPAERPRTHARQHIRTLTSRHVRAPAPPRPLFRPDRQ